MKKIYQFILSAWALFAVIPMFFIYPAIRQVPHWFYDKLDIIDYENPLERNDFEVESALTVAEYASNNATVTVFKTYSEYKNHGNICVRAIAVNSNRIAILQQLYENIAGVSMFDADWNFICGYTIIVYDASYLELNDNCLNVFANKICTSIDLSADVFALWDASEGHYQIEQLEYELNDGNLKICNDKNKLKNMLSDPSEYSYLIQTDSEGNETVLIDASDHKDYLFFIDKLRLSIFAITVILVLPYSLIWRKQKY